ncbi:hypothetical protein BaRGS_00018304, partial [Batillaria attramentaria]
MGDKQTLVTSYRCHVAVRDNEDTDHSDQWKSVLFSPTEYSVMYDVSGQADWTSFPEPGLLLDLSLVNFCSLVVDMFRVGPASSGYVTFDLSCYRKFPSFTFEKRELRRSISKHVWVPLQGFKSPEIKEVGPHKKSTCQTNPVCLSALTTLNFVKPQGHRGGNSSAVEVQYGGSVHKAPVSDRGEKHANIRLT